MLNGMLTALNRFISRYAQQALSFYRLLRKQTESKWNTECNDTLESLKRILATPLVLHQLLLEETLYLFLAVA